MMSFFKLIRFSMKDIFSQKRISSFFVINLILGFLGFFLLQIFQNSLVLETQSKAQETLGGDLVISVRRELTIEEKEKFDAKLKNQFVAKTQYYDFFAMTSYKTDKLDSKTRLVLVKAVEESYPLYGQFKKTLFQDNQDIPIFVDPEIIDQFQIDTKKTNQISLGDQKFNLSGIIQSDPTRTFRFGALAPSVYIRYTDLPKTNLIKTGSTITSVVSYKLKNPTDANTLKKEFEKDFTDSSIRFSSAFLQEDSGNRVFDYLLDYLNLVSLVAIGLSFLCLGYMLQWLFQLQIKNTALFKILGLSHWQAVQTQIIKNFVLSLFAFSIATLFVLILKRPLEQTMYSYFEVSAKLDFTVKSFLVNLVFIIMGPQLVAIPSYLNIYQMDPLPILKGQNHDIREKFNLQKNMVLLGLMITFWLIAILQSQSFLIGSAFTGALLAIGLSTILVLFLFKGLIQKIAGRFSFQNKYAVTSLLRQKKSTYLIFTTMTLSIAILVLLPQIKKSILAELRPQSASKIPSLFMFDIQPEQVAGLEKIVLDKAQQTLQLTPLVRSRILKMNDADYERKAESGFFKTREDENEARFRNRGVNLTYKKDLQDSETVIKGRWFSSKDSHKDSDIPEISLEERYADRVGAKLNDVMTFDVQGLEIKGRITSIRRVRWTSFQPNFFVVFQPGVLEEAPQVFLSAANNLSTDQVRTLQTDIVNTFSNISIIDVRESVEKSLVFIDKMALALQIMAGLSLVVGFFIFIILINTQVRERLSEMNLLQVLGAQLAVVYSIFVKQFALIILFSLFFGLLFGLTMAYFLMETLFRLSLTFDFTSLGVLIILLTVVLAGIIYFATRPISKLQPLQLLKDGA